VNAPAMLFSMLFTSYVFGSLLIKLGAAKIDRAIIYSTFGTLAGVLSYISFDLNDRASEILELVLVCFSMFALCMVIAVPRMLFKGKSLPKLTKDSAGKSSQLKNDQQTKLVTVLLLRNNANSLIIKVKNLNFRHRLLAVFAALYFVGALISGISSYYESRIHSGATMLKRAYLFTIFTRLDADKLNVIKKESMERCMNSSEDEWLTQSDTKIKPNAEGCESIGELKVEWAGYKKSPNYLGFALVLIIYPVLFMFGVWLIILVVRWLVFGKKIN
jgi:hypothetical protein